MTDQFYERPQPKGYPAWYPRMNRKNWRLEMEVAKACEALHKEQGTAPTREYLESLDEETRRMVVGNFHARIQEDTDYCLFRPCAEWWHAHGVKLIGTVSEDCRVMLDFKTRLDRERFLRAFPRWRKRPVHTWYDNPKINEHFAKKGKKGIPTGESKYGRNKFYDLPTRSVQRND